MDAKDEIKATIIKEKEILKALLERRQELEKREARMGFNTPPEVTNEISEYDKRILRKTAEIEKLQTMYVEDDLSLEEAEYRSELAIAWSSGKMTTMFSTSLELTRLRLGLTVERAKSLEMEIKSSIAKEILSEAEVPEIIYMIREQISYLAKVDDETNLQALSLGVCQSVFASLSRLSRAINLDEKMVARAMNFDVNHALQSNEINKLIELAITFDGSYTQCKLIRFYPFLRRLEAARKSHEEMIGATPPKAQE